MEIKYPDVTVKLVGGSDNVFAIIGSVSKELRRKVSKEAADEFVKEANSSESYDKVLQLCMKTVNVE